MTSKQFRLISAGIGASAVLAMGALGAVFSPAPAGTGTVSEGLEITLGETITSTTGQTEIATSLAVPEVTAEALPPPP